MACVITFIVTLIATIIIIVIFIFIKKKTDIAKDTTGGQNIATADTAIYDTVGPPNLASNKGEYEIQNPAYDTSHRVGMDTNSAHKNSK